MPPEHTIVALLANAGHPPHERERAAARRAARAAWAREIVAAWKAAQEAADEAWMRLVEGLPEDIDDEEADALPPPPEQAALNAIQAQIDAVRHHDRWPRELYWSL